MPGSIMELKPDNEWKSKIFHKKQWIVNFNTLIQYSGL